MEEATETIPQPMNSEKTLETQVESKSAEKVIEDKKPSKTEKSEEKLAAQEKIREKVNEEYEETKGKTRLDYYCELCDAHMNSLQVWETHIQGKRHKKNVTNAKEGKDPKSVKRTTPIDAKPILQACVDKTTEPIVGLDFILETQKGEFEEPTYNCLMCHSTCLTTTVMSHILGSKHRLAYIKTIDEPGYDLIMSMKLKKSALSAIVEERAAELEEKKGRGKIEVKIERKQPPPAPKRDSKRSRDYSDESDQYSDDYHFSRRKRQERPSDFGRFGPDFDRWGNSEPFDFVPAVPMAPPEMMPISYPLPNLKNMSTGDKLHVLEQVSNFIVLREQEARALTKIIHSLTKCLLQYKIQSLPSHTQDMLTKALLADNAKGLESVIASGDFNLDAVLNGLNSNRGGGIMDWTDYPSGYGNSRGMSRSGMDSSGMQRGSGMMGRGASQMGMSSSGLSRNVGVQGDGNNMMRNATSAMGGGMGTMGGGMGRVGPSGMGSSMGGMGRGGLSGMGSSMGGMGRGGLSGMGSSMGGMGRGGLSGMGRTQASSGMSGMGGSMSGISAASGVSTWSTPSSNRAKAVAKMIGSSFIHDQQDIPQKSQNAWQAQSSSQYMAQGYYGATGGAGGY